MTIDNRNCYNTIVRNNMKRNDLNMPEKQKQLFGIGSNYFLFNKIKIIF